ARPLVSVIVPTHNRAMLLARALDSVFSQYGVGEQFDLEVIVIDDASTDSTSNVMQQSYPGARYIRFTQSRGVAGARNAGVAVSQGAFVAFLDDDDVWLPGHLRLQIPAFKRHPEAGVVYSQVFFAPYGKPDPVRSRAPSGWIFTSLLMGSVMLLQSM